MLVIFVDFGLLSYGTRSTKKIMTWLCEGIIKLFWGIFADPCPVRLLGGEHRQLESVDHIVRSDHVWQFFSDYYSVRIFCLLLWKLNFLSSRAVATRRYVRREYWCRDSLCRCRKGPTSPKKILFRRLVNSNIIRKERGNRKLYYNSEENWKMYYWCWD